MHHSHRDTDKLTRQLDASRFLAQSQSRVGFNEPEEPRRNPLQRQRRQDQTTSRHQSTRSYLQRPGLGGNPYKSGGSIAQFPFASRTAAPNAPLFYSATAEQFAEDDDEEEHEREVADFYALQRSRRQFGGSRLEESSEADDDGSRGSGLNEDADGRDQDERGRVRGGGIKSSWLGDKIKARGRRERLPRTDDGRSPYARAESEGSSKSKGKMVDVGLESAAQSTMDGDEPPDDLAIEIPPDDDPPSIQQFRNPPTGKLNIISPFLPQQTSPEDVDSGPQTRSSDDSDTPPTIAEPAIDPPRHDAFWGTFYLISLAALFASFLLVYLHTAMPKLKHPLGDTVYTSLLGSYHLLAVDTVVAVIVSLLWLAVLRSYVRPLVYAILIAVPIILFSFFLYPLVASFQGKYKGASIQDQAMRWFSFIPAILAVTWAFGVYKGRHSFAKAISILEFSCRILAANTGLLLVGFATLAAVITWTWMWTAMFTRVFLGGHLTSVSAKIPFLIDASTWWLGAFFILVYLWTLGVLSGIQRATTAATVSQWYFHRLTVPAPTSQAVIRAASAHATTTLFGTICLSTLLALAIRLPFLILPRRLTALAGLCSYTMLPSTIATLTNPLTLTYSAIHSQPLVTSSRALSRLNFQSPTSKQSAPFRSRNAPSQIPLHSYTLALLFLRATRFITALALGFGGWVNTARSLTLDSARGGGETVKGSLYAYIVGLIAAAIGWGVLGAIDGVVAGIVDAVVVCWGSEVARGEVRYCREAEYLFGEDEHAAAEEEGQSFLRR